ncbi:MAG: sigma 54-interacting transcriptional regulator [Deltaproteobacteria bacterium]|nr:sigma 54-interacting transcriptional regulator [Deltaproteobacteria bacterium]
MGMTPEELIARGRYDDALVELHALRRSEPEGQRVDLAMGVALLRRGEIDRAQLHLERCLDEARRAGDTPREAAALTALGEVFLHRADTETATTALRAAREQLKRGARGDVWARCCIGLAELAMHHGEHGECHALVEDALATATTTSALVAAHLTLARCEHALGDLLAADRAARAAINLAAELPRERAEAYLAYAHLVGEAGDAMNGIAADHPAGLLARAQELLREHGSLTDLERLRRSFHRFGRRGTDQVKDDQIRPMLEELRDARTRIDREMHRLVDAVRLSAPQVAPIAADAEREIVANLLTMSAAEDRTLTATQLVISQRETIRILLELVRTLNQIGDYKRLLAESCRMTAQLTRADRAVVAVTSATGTLEIRETLHIPDSERTSSPDLRSSSPDLLRPSSPEMGLTPPELRLTPPELRAPADTPWRRALDLVLETRRPTLIESETATSRGGNAPRTGSALVVPMRRGNHILGALYVDKELCGGVFTDDDLDLLALFATQVSTILQNVRSAEELRIAARSRAATLEAISDGVLTLDPNGTITSVNSRAARILAIAPNAKPNLRLFPDLSMLRATLERGEEIEGRVSRIGAAEYVLNARVVRSDERDIAGVVVTLTEMQRAKSIAQRIVGSHARYSFADIVGQSAILKSRLTIAEAAARSDSNVLITGESGTGKEVVAQAIHNASARAGGPFVGINCSAIPRELLESELFGYEAGAFTGARRGGQPGKFELAEGGTMLLDEIGDMPLEMQAKLLRVLQERRVRRIGAAREVAVDARVIATTNRELDEAVAQQQFRADLLFRIKVIHIQLPPLRERAADIPVLADHFLHLFAARLGKRVRGVAPNVMAAFQRYEWPGNIRELENVLESEVNLIDADATELDRIPDAVRRHRGPASVVTKTSALTFEDAERALLVQALARHGGSIPEVARALGVSRGTVYNKLNRYGIDPSTYRG